MVQGPLICDQCGCLSDRQAKDWAAFLGHDVEGPEETCVCVFCPVCAAEQFGYRESTAADAYT